MKDAIDKRNEKDRIARSIVKRRNIVYISKEELERKQREEEQQRKKEAKKAAEDLVKQLKEEQNKKQAMDIERLLAEQAMLERQLATGMDATGKNPMSGVTQERVEAILSEKSKQLREIIAANRMELEQKHTSVETNLSKKHREDGTGAEGGSSGNDTSAQELAAEDDSLSSGNVEGLAEEEIGALEMEEAEPASEEAELMNGEEAEPVPEETDLTNGEEREPVLEEAGSMMDETGTEELMSEAGDLEPGPALEGSGLEEVQILEAEEETEGETEA